ncbi:MAG: bifunctional transaldolase/phosoglucose isomerase [Candidatus Dormibacteria bacterium]
MASNPLTQLGEQGQSVWLDFISRELVTTGELERLIAEENVTGLTSNPTIFEKAIADGIQYDEHISQLLSDGAEDPGEVFLGVAISDIRDAADQLGDVHERTGGADGFVSLELSPDLAHNSAGSIETARRYWQRVDRPNLMIKVPATPEGIPVIEELISEGINVNVTLIFALSAYVNVIDAYINGLRRRHDAKQPLNVHSVASFFVSRVDTAVDKLIDAKVAADPANPQLEALYGTAAIANARLAYELFEKRFRGSEFADLAQAGGQLQRPLWASTSAKNPKYRDVLYAEALVGPDTVDTMPPATIEAFRDHGEVTGDTVRHDLGEAHEIFDRLRGVGIDIDAVTEELQVAGVKSFADSYNQLIEVIAEKVDALRRGYGKRQNWHLAATTKTVTDAISAGAQQRVAERIWARDADLWKPGDESAAASIHNRLGWLDVIGAMQVRSPDLMGLSTEVRDADFADAVLLGMGGSSLCPEVLRASFGSAAGYPLFHVLDTTDPGAIARLSESIDPKRTLFIAASKSGTTLETISHLGHFWQVVTESGVASPGSNFVAITDPGTPLATLARERGFRRLFKNQSDIGGRYSALSYFGLVPAAVMGIDIETLLARAALMRQNCAASTPGALNCGLALGSIFSLYHAAGRDKITILAPPRIAAFGLWAEQLIAESTGKEGRGLIPIGAEPIGESRVYGDDRLFVALQLGTDDSDFDAQVGTLVAAGQPVVILELDDLFDLGAEFFRWEFATAVAAVSLQSNPFDEPNVQESKDNTKRVLGGYEKDGSLPSDDVALVWADGIGIQGDVTGATPSDALRSWVTASVQSGDYVAVMAYCDPTAAHEASLQAFRVALREATTAATTLGFGPRFLHSTGQLHKGGPNTGVYIQITVDDPVDVPIPGQAFTFSVLKQAQARGDIESLRHHERRAISLHIDGDLDTALARLTEAIGAAVSVAR